MAELFDVLIIGQGYSGLTAAKLAAQRGLRTINFESYNLGGLILNINELDPSPLDGEPSSGADIASNLLVGNMEQGVVCQNEAVTAVERGEENNWIVKTESTNYSAPHVIVASGARLRKLGVPGEEDFSGRGVSECADCDGPMYMDRETIVVGGGDSAFQEALKLAEYASKVTIVMRGSAPRARPDLRARVEATAKIFQLTNSQVAAIEGSQAKGVEGVLIRTGGVETKVAADAVFVFTGLEPNTAFLPAELARDNTGALVTSDRCDTSVEGIWAIGAVRSGFAGTLKDADVDAQRVIAALP